MLSKNYTDKHLPHRDVSCVIRSNTLWISFVPRSHPARHRLTFPKRSKQHLIIAFAYDYFLKMKKYGCSKLCVDLIMTVFGYVIILNEKSRNWRIISLTSEK